MHRVAQWATEYIGIDSLLNQKLYDFFRLNAQASAQAANGILGAQAEASGVKVDAYLVLLTYSITSLGWSIDWRLCFS